MMMNEKANSPKEQDNNQALSELSDDATSTDNTVDEEFLDSPEDLDTDNIEPRSKSKNILLILCVCLLLILIVGMSYLGYQYWQTQLDNTHFKQALTTEQQESFSQIEEQLKDYKTQLEQKDNVIKELSQTATALDQESQLFRQQLVSLQDRLRLLTSQGKQEWMLEQVDYYLTLAQQKLVFENNINAVVALLYEADDVLKELNDLNLSSLRKVIAQDIARLNALPVMDTVGVISQLEALATQINSLSPSISIQLPTKTEIQPKEYEHFTDRFFTTLEKFGKEAINIRHHDTLVPPLLTEQQKSILSAALQLKVTQTQSAVLNHQEVLFQSHLQSIEHLLTQYFALSESHTVFKTLNKLHSIPIKNQLNAITLSSLVELNNEKEQRRLRWLQSSDKASFPKPIMNKDETP